jgi:hypothetical protein
MRLSAPIGAAIAALATSGLLAMTPSAVASGSGWQAVAGPTTTAIQLSDIDTVNQHSAWAVGISYTSDQPTDPGTAVVEHWDGATWSAAGGTLPDADGFTNLTALSDTNIWVSGYTDREYGATQVWHYDGTTWTALPSTGLPATIRGRVLATTGHTWLVGQVDAGLPAAGAVIATFHGSASSGHWTVQHLARVGGFYGATARTAKDAWAVGSTSQYQAAGHAVIAHWNGKKWALATIGSIKGQLTGVAADGAHDVMAVGLQTPSHGGLEGGLAVHWNGKKWASSHLPCKVACQLSTVATGPSASYWASGHGPLEARASVYLHFTNGKWHAAVSGPTQDIKSSERRVDVLGIARVPGTSTTLSVGYATSKSGQFSKYQPLRETQTN